jgi:hypothetical protein
MQQTNTKEIPAFCTVDRCYGYLEGPVDGNYKDLHLLISLMQNFLKTVFFLLKQIDTLNPRWVDWMVPPQGSPVDKTAHERRYDPEHQESDKCVLYYIHAYVFSTISHNQNRDHEVDQSTGLYGSQSHPDGEPLFCGDRDIHPFEG